ncbi:MAG: hypothetical protein WA323_22070 [Candidatus Nitrosopolaris sp.]
MIMALLAVLVSRTAAEITATAFISHLSAYELTNPVTEESPVYTEQLIS